MKRAISLFLSFFFIVTLVSSAAVSGVMISSAQAPNGVRHDRVDDFIRTVKVSPPVLKIFEHKDGTFDIKVARGSDKGIFYVALSLFTDSPILKSRQSMFFPPVLNFEQGESSKNATLVLRDLPPDEYKFKVTASAASPSGIDSAQSDVVTLVVDKNPQFSDSEQLTENSRQQGQAAARTQDFITTKQDAGQKTKPDESTTRPSERNQAPVARAGPDQESKEGDRVVLDGSASTDPDRDDTLSYTWEQVFPKKPLVRLEQQLINSPRNTFQAPNVVKDTPLVFKLTVKDNLGAWATDTVQISVNGVVTSERQQPPELNDGQTDNLSTVPGPSSTDINHSPVAISGAIISTLQNEPVLISLQGSDPDNNDRITFTLIGGNGPSFGTIAGFDKNTGSLTYIPNNGFIGEDSLRFKVIDESGAESNEASVMINVKSATEKEDEQTTTSAVSDVSSTVAERLKERQELVASKLKETRGEKIANQFIVVLKKDSPATQTQGLVDDAKDRGAKVLQQYHKALNGFTINIQNIDGLAAILNDSDVAYAEPDVRVKASAQTLPTGVDRVDGDLSSAASGDGKGDAINADIAILDTGIDLTHPDLNVYKHVTYVPGTTTGNDDNGHGTMVAGIAAAKDNGFGSVGVAPGSRLWAVKVLDSTGTGSLSSVLQGLDFVTSKANELEVADLSFGCDNCTSPTLNSAIDNAIAAGVTIVAAAGNGAKDASTFSPANHPDVIAVSAIADSDGKCGAQGGSTSGGADDSIASFSNYGSTIDMAAPGVQIYSTSKNGGYSVMSGTSMAAPHVAGAAALYLSQSPNASPSQVIVALNSQASTNANQCDGKGQGYFTNDKDSSKEPLLYVGILSTSPILPEPPASQANNTSSNIPTNTTGSGPTPGPQSPPSANTTTSNSTNKGNATTTTPFPPPLSGNTTGNLGNTTGIGNQTSGNQTLLGNMTSGNQTFKAASVDPWFFSRSIGQGYLTQPHGVDVDPATGKIYVANTGGHNITVFNADGSKDTSFGSFGNAGPEDLVFIPNYPFAGATSCPGGQPPGCPVLIVTDPSTTAPAAPAVDFYFPNGTLIFHFTGSQLGMTMPNPKPYGIGAITTPSGSPPEFYVVDLNHREVQHYPPAPIILIPGGGFGSPGLHPLLPPMTNPNFLLPLDVGCCLLSPDGSDSYAYVTDAQGGGAGISWYNARASHAFVDDNVSRFPYGIDVIPGTTSSGRIIVSDQTFQEVVSYNSTGGFKGKVSGVGPAQVISPAGIAVVPDQPGGDTVYVAEHGNSRISVFVNSNPAANQPPVAISQSITVTEDVAKSIKLNATDADNDDLTYSLPSGTITAQGGSLENFNPSTGDLTYRPPSDYNGPDSFDFEVSDGTDTSNLATISITVNAVNDAPVARDDRYSPVYQDSGPNTLAVGQNDSDAELDQFSNLLCIDSTTDPLHGSVEIAQECGGALMSVRYTPDPGFVGTDTFNYTITNGESPPLCCDSAKVTVEVVDNVPPTVPQLIYPVAKGINDNTPTFDWSDVNDSSPVTYSFRVENGSGTPIDVNSLVNSTFTPSSPLDDGTYFWRVWATDSFGNGNIGFNNVTNFAIDTVQPAAPVTISPANLSSTTNDWVSLEGTAESPSSPGADGFSRFTTVRVYDNVSGLLGTVQLDGSTFENWSFNATSLAGGTHAFRTTVTDGANNTSPLSAATIVTLESPVSDTTPPPAPTLSSPTNASSTNDNTPTFDWSDVTDPSTPITYDLLVDNDNSFGSPIISQTGLASSTFTPSSALADSLYYWKVSAKDSVGNTASSSTFYFFVDTANPQPPDVFEPENGAYLKDNTFAIGGRAAEPSLINVFINGTSVGTNHTVGDGNCECDVWSLQLSSPLADGFYVITATQTDDASNNSTSSAPVHVTVDTLEPSLLSTFPVEGATDVPLDAVLNVTFNEKLNSRTINATTVHLIHSNGTVFVNSQISLIGDNKTIEVEPVNELLPETQYVAKVEGGTRANSVEPTVKDLAGNPVSCDETGNDCLWSFTTGDGTGGGGGNASFINITSVNDTSLVWGIDSLGIGGDASPSTNATSENSVLLNWGDGTNSTSIVGSDGLWNASHLYGATAVGTNTIDAILIDSNGAILANTTTQVEVEKHTTSLSARIKSSLVADAPFTVSGNAFDTSYGSGNLVPISGIEISFNGSGATEELGSVTTQGVTFSAPSGGGGGGMSISNCAACSSDLYDGSTGNKVLRTPVNTIVTFPENVYGLRATFDDMGTAAFGLNVELTNGTTKQYSLEGGSTLDEKGFGSPISRVVVTSSASGYVGWANFVTLNPNGDPKDERKSNFETFNTGPVPSRFVINASSYYSVGRAVATNPPNVFEVAAYYLGNESFDAAVTDPVTYKTQERSPDQGGQGEEAHWDPDVPATYNKPAEFGSGTDSNLCSLAYKGAAGSRTILGDDDSDGICDTWEGTATAMTPSTEVLGTGNVALIRCPERSTVSSFIDSGVAPVDCNNNAVTYDLCFNDRYADVWGNRAKGEKICPRKSHKDIFVEIDYFASQVPSDAAIKDVIMAFGNAPITNTGQDDFGRTKGITLHVVLDEQLSFSDANPIAIWWDGDSTVGDDFDSIKLGSTGSFTDGNFGADPDRYKTGGNGQLVNERLQANAAIKLVMKHYIYRYGVFLKTWGGPSGIAEILGNDFVVSLGSGFTGTKGSRQEVAGTFMHELGHTLNLGHGGPALDSITSDNYDMNCKANYFSVMSYSRQMPTDAFPAGNTANNWDYVRDTSGNPTGGTSPNLGTSTWPGSALDYSRGAHATLTEDSGLSESGIPTVTATGDPVRALKFIYGNKNSQGVRQIQTGFTGQTVDWNGNGNKGDAGLVSGDPNSIASSGCPANVGGGPPQAGTVFDTEKSYSEWGAIKIKILGSDNSQDGFGPDSPETEISRGPQEMGPTFVNQVEQRAIDSGIVGPPDATPPNTAIVSAIDGDGKSIANNGLSSSNTIKFTFSGSDDVGISEFECSIDSPTPVWENCLSPQTYSSLAEGQHSVKIRAIDAAGNVDATPASRTWTINLRPTVTSTVPLGGAVDVPATSKVSATFSEKIQPSSLTTSTFAVKDTSTNTNIASSSLVLSSDGKTATFTPKVPLKFLTTYTATIKGGTSGVKDLAGNPLATDFVWSFKTAAQTIVFTGLMQPINQDGSSIFPVTKNIPVKLQLKNSAGQFITNAKLTFTAERVSPTITGTVSETQTASSFTTGSLFKYNTATNTYEYNWKAPPLFRVTGTYALKIIMDYGTPSEKLLQGPQPPTASGETGRVSLK